MHFLAAFGPADESTAILEIAAVVCWILGAFFAPAGRWKSGGIGLVSLGLALWFFPVMWNTVENNFS